MKTIFAISLATLLCLPALASDVPGTPTEDGGMLLKLTPEQWATCQAMGGCMVIPRQMLEEGIKRIVRNTCGKDV